MENVARIEQIRKENAEFARLYEEHQRLARQIDELERLPHLTTEQDLEVKRLKKLKLRSKDAMARILAQQKRAGSEG